MTFQNHLMRRALLSLLFILTSSALFAQTNILLKGIVISSSDNLPVIGASVVVKGTTIGTVTNIDGEYVLQVPHNATAIDFSYIGLEPLSIAFKPNDLGVFRVVTMREDFKQLEDVVVVGFGTQKKESVIGAIQSVKSKDLIVPSSSLTSAFAGRIAGVIAVQRSGEPGADGANFWIRGVSTFAGATNPLIVMDGVEISSSDLNTIAPESIESFSVLKDATATALYGAKGANGVMIITTKSGRDMDKPRINVRVENFFTQPTQLPKLANGITYMNMYNEAEYNRNPDRTEAYFSSDKIIGTKDGLNPYIYPNMDWYDMMFSDLSSNQSINLNVTGGSRKMDYFINASIFNESGMLKNNPANKFNTNIDQKRYSFQSNINAELTPTTKVGLRLMSQIRNYSGPSIDTRTLFTKAMQVNPVEFPAFFPQTEDVNHVMFGHRTSYGVENPLALYLSGQKNDFETTVLTTFTLDQDLRFVTKGLSAKGLISFKNWNHSSTRIGYEPFLYEISDYSQLPDGSYEYQLSNIKSGTEAIEMKGLDRKNDRTTNIQFSLNYNRTFDKIHDLSAMLLYHQREYNAPSDDFYTTLPLREQGLAGRATYNFDNRYFGEFNFGYNGSENFQRGKRFGFFPSVAAGYIISNEEYFNSLRHTIHLLKVRGSYGLVGNSYSDPRFPYITEVILNDKDHGFIFGEQWNNSLNGMSIRKYGQENATWETGEKINAGLELGLFNKFTLIADLFQEVRSGIFMQRRTVPSTVGIGSAQPYANIGVVRNRGVDFSLEYNHAFRSDFIVSFKGNFTYAANELLEKDEPDQLFDYQSEIGRSLNIPYGLIAIGLFESEEDIANSPTQTFMSNVKPGDIKYKNMNDDEQIDEFDETFFGNPRDPQIVYGFGGSLRYKRFDVSLFFQGVAKTSLMMEGIHPFGEYRYNVLDFVANDYWSQSNPNSNAAYPRLSDTSSPNNTRSSTFWERDGSFLRLKNAEIGYTYKFLRAYVNGSNLLTFSKFKYWDPEIGSGSGLSYPTLRVINVGLQLNF